MVEAITSVWSSIATWLTGQFSNISALFYTPGSGSESGELTLIGFFAVVMAGIAILLLVFNLIRSFFPMRG